MKRKWLIVGILGFFQLLVCAGIIAVLWIGGRSTGGARFFYVTDVHIVETIEETFSVDGPAILDVESSSSDVDVTISEGDAVEIKATLDLWGADEEDARQQLDVQMRRDGDKIVVRVVEQPRVYVAAYVNSSRVTFDIQVPADTSLQLETLVGDLDVEGGTSDAVLRAVDIRSSSGEISITGLDSAEGIAVDATAGDVRLEDVTANSLVAHTSSGSLELINLSISNDAEIETTAGDVDIQRLSAKSLVADTSSGELTVTDLDVDGDVEIKTSSGDAILKGIEAGSLAVRTSPGLVRVENGTVDGALNLVTTSGDIDVVNVHAPAYTAASSAGSIMLNGCGGPVNVRVVSGDVEIRNCWDAVLDIETSSGLVDFAGSLAAEGEHRVKSSVGDVKMELPADAAFDLDVQTTHGDIDIASDFSVMMTRVDEHAVEGEVNGGGPLLRVHSRSGSVTLLSGAKQ